MPKVRLLMPLILALILDLSTATADEHDHHALSGMKLRSIGPALTSGRVADFAFHPTQKEIYYVAMASGGVWKTMNNGISWSPIFEKEGSYATGVIELDPANPSTLWLGTGENNSQRSVGFGDGVYRSRDGGSSWERLGLADSGHISMIRFAPDHSGHVFVAAQGPLWNSGGDRGLYRTTDHGETWERILHIDEDTGVNEFVIHPQQAGTMVASSYQRRRHVWTLINGGPGSGVHKTTDGGKTWRRIKSGLPTGLMGRIGLAAAPSKPELLYAVVEASAEERGIYRSTDFGESWEKRSDHLPGSPQYYNELIVDPNNPERVYAVDTFTHVSEDGGKTWARLSIKNRHVDDHALWIDPENSAHLIIGGDGGIYESWDGGDQWRHVRNLPTVQFYRATADNSTPFYNVCGGTQDNHTLCGPIRTQFTDGITNADWWIARTGDGFKARMDPDNPNILYAQYQYGGLHRFDRITGESIAITPQPRADEDAPKWNWNAPLLISSHDPARLYYASERVYRSDNRGNSWVPISGDLSRGLDRNQLEVMGRVWSVDAVAKNNSTSMYGSVIALAESPLDESLIYAGTDDGLLQVTTNGGETWSQVSSVPSVPDQSLVEDLEASLHDPAVAYAVIDNHKRGDHKPYVLRTRNQGKSWEVISGNLPARGSAHTIVEDHTDPNLLFVGTEFGLFFTQQGGERWFKMKDLPTIAVRDLDIQRRENDLVVGTFGLGIYILDDYSPLRTNPEKLDRDALLFPVRDSWQFVPDGRRGWGGKGDWGTGRYTADNPPHGAVIRYHLAEPKETQRKQRLATEKSARERGDDNPYPSWDELRLEDREEAPAAVLTVRDSSGAVIRRIDGPVSKGLNEVAWDLRHAATDPVSLDAADSGIPWIGPPQGPLAIPGNYSVSLAIREQGALEDTGQVQHFTVKPLNQGSLDAADPASLLAFQQETQQLYRAVSGADKALDEMALRLEHLVKAVNLTSATNESHAQAVRSLRERLREFDVQLNGDRTVTGRNESAPLPITRRVQFVLYGHQDSRAEIPEAYRESRAIAEGQFESLLSGLHELEVDLVALEDQLEAAGAPWTPGRLPRWPAESASDSG